ncbi:MAG: PilZ domain-containing protein [Deltaproteobacteria bacterium]|jgi:c-di-GMP-binding flagellar brake protein YcgR
MPEYEKITGAAIPKLFEELLHQKTQLKVTVVDSDYEHLAPITALVNRKKMLHFVIDATEGLAHAAAEIDLSQLHFEFTGKDHIKYTFRTTGEEIDNNRIYVRYPREVERWQRRELFRLNAPEGTKLRLPLNSVRYELDVIDISIGGTLAALVRTSSHDPGIPPFTDAQILADIELVFPPEIMRQPIRLDKVQVKRSKMISGKTGCEVAFAFYEISTDEQQRLTDLIYRLQRQSLRNRLPTGL